MNAPNVRSATVRLNAEVAKYIADMKAAGRATHEAFDRSHVSISTVDRDLVSATRSSDAMAVQTQRTGTALRSMSTDNDRLVTSLRRSDNAIDRTSGRLALLAKTVAVLGPALGPIGAVGIAGIAGIASQVGFAAVGVTSLVVATRGLGDALKAVEKARLDPTVENLQAAHEALRDLAPEAQGFVARMQELRPVFAGIRNQAAAGWFPGLTEALDHFEVVAPRVGRIFKAVGEAGGDLVADAAQALAGPEWADFLTFIKQEAPEAITDLGHTAGNLVTGMAQLWMAFSPVNNDFSDWLLDVSESFEDWATNLSETDGFKNFVDYLRTNGPKVADAAGAIGNALLQIVQAAAPLGGPVLEAITGIANAFAAIAASPLGTPIMVAVTAMSALSLASAAATASVTRLNASMALLGVTSKKTAVATAGASAATGVAGAGGLAGVAGLAGIPGINLILLGLIANLANVGIQLDKFEEGSQSAGETIAKTLIPGFREMALVDELFNLTPDAVPFLEQFEEFSRSNLLDQVPDKLGALGVSFVDVREKGEDFTKSQKRFANQMLRNEELIQRTTERVTALNDAVAAEQDTMRAAAESFFDYGTQVSAADFELGNWLDKQERNARALERFEENATKAAEKGLKFGLIQELRSMGREGRIQLAALADASESEIARANRAFDRGSEGADNMSARVRNTRLRLIALGNTDAKPKVSVFGVGKVYDDLGSVRDKLAALGEWKAKPRLELLGADTAREQMETTRNKLQLLGTTDAKPKIAVLGADAATTAAARVRGAILSIPLSRTSTITTNFVTNRTVNTSPGFGPVERAGGGLVVGPGGPRDDLIPAMVSNREYVVQAAAVDKYGVGFFDRANAMRLADGGQPGRSTQLLTRSSDDAADKEVRRETEHRKRLNAQLKESEKAVERERKQRDAVVDRMKEISSSIRDSLLTDLGGESDNAWTSEFGSGTLAGNLATIRGDTVEARRMRRLVKILEGKGFDGPALADLLSRGDINEVASYASSSRGQLRRFEQAFAERAQLVRAVGRQGADAALGDRLDTANDELREANRELRQIKQRLQQANKDRKDEHQKDRTAQKRGAGDAARNRRRNP